MNISEIRLTCMVPTGSNANSLRASTQKDLFTSETHAITLEKGEVVITRKVDGGVDVRVPYHNVAWYVREADK